MTIRQWSGSVLLAWGMTMIVGIAAYGQAQDAQKPAAIIAPEQMLDEALRRYDVGDYNEAFNYVQRAKAMKPDLEKIKLVEGLLYLEMRPKRTSDAIPRLTDYNNSPEGKNDYRGNAALGKVYKESRMYQQAIRPLEKAQKLAPVEHEGKPLRALITMDLAECHYGMKKDKLAIATAKEGESMAPNDPGIQLQLGRIASNTKDYESAVRAADRALGLLNAKTRSDPFKVQDVKDLQECVDLKIKVFISKLESNMKDAQTQAELAMALREKADIERRLNLLKAREAGVKGIANDPKLYKLQVFVAGVEAELGGVQDAIDRLNDTINNDPGNEAAIKLRAEIQSRAVSARP